MVNIKTILSNNGINIIFNTDKKLLHLKVLQSSYNENGFNECLVYIENTFKYIKENQLKCSFLCDLRSENNIELPLNAYVKLVNLITQINSILVTNCHCIIILSNNSKKWKDIYNFITKLWRPDNQRPLEFMENEDFIDSYILKNKLHN